MNQKQITKLENLFNKFANEEQASSFAVNNLFNRVLSIINKQEVQTNNIDKEG